MQSIKTKEIISQLRNSVDNAASFLIESKDIKGWWKDFYVGRNPSDEWITAYVAVALASVPNHQARRAAVNAWELLATRCRTTGGWGFNPLIPEDADSTGWVLQLAEVIGAEDSELAHRARSFIHSHFKSDGGISTYASDVGVKTYLEESVRLFWHKIKQGRMQDTANDATNEELERQFKIFAVKHRQPLRKVLSVSDEELQDCLNSLSQESFAGWCQSHICVSAAIASLNEFRPILQDYLMKTQLPDGHWPCYWWVDHEYATAFAIEALEKENSETYQVYIDKAVEWGMKRLNNKGFIANERYPEGSPFSTSLCLRLLLRKNKNDQSTIAARNSIIEWLLKEQNPQGSWASSARLRIPHTHDIDPNQTVEWLYNGMFNGSILEDRHCTFTTATVMHSLQKSLEFLSLSL